MINLFQSDISDESLNNSLDLLSKSELLEFIIQLRKSNAEKAFQSSYENEIQDLYVEILDAFIDIKLEDADLELNTSLKKLGNFFGAARIFIFDINPATGFASISFEWCAEGTSSQFNSLKNIPCRNFPEWYDAHKRGEIYYVPDITSLNDNNSIKRGFSKEGIKSVFSVPLMNDGQLIGFVGIDFIRQFNTGALAQEKLPTVIAKMLVNLKNRIYAISEIKGKERFLADLMENSGSVTYIKKLDGTYVRVNKTWEEVTGHPRENVIGRTDFDLFEEGIAKQFRQNDLQVMQENKKIIIEEILLVNNNLKHFISVKFPTYDAKGLVIGMAGMSTEITELKRVESFLREQEAHLNAILNSSLESIWSINSNYEITFVNNILYEDFLRAFGKELKKGVCIIDLLPEILREYWKEKYAYVLKGEVLDFNEKVLGESEVFYLNIRMFPVIVDEEVVGVAVFSRNLTKQILAIEERDAHFDTIEKQNQILKEIAWMQSHQVRAPLARMLGLINLYNDSNGEDDAFFSNEKVLKSIRESAHELDEIIKHISEKTYLSDQIIAPSTQQN